MKKANALIRVLTAMGLLGWVLTCMASSAAAKAGGKYGGDYRVPLYSEPVTLDPALYNDIYSHAVAQNLFDGLVQFDKNLRVVPCIARRWKISRDHLTYVFFLKEGVRFHNGREVTADDFIFSFTRILDPEKRSPVASIFSRIKGGEAFRKGASPSVEGLKTDGRYKLKIELEEPFAPFLSILAMINAKVVPKEAVSDSFSKAPVGTGPFRLRAWEPGRQIVLERNSDYFGGRPYLKNLTFKIYFNMEWEKIYADFEQGMLDQSIVPSNKYDIIKEINRKKRYTTISKPGLNLVYIGMNSAMKPLDDRRVRMAINYAVDTERIVREVTKRGSVPARGILPPGIPGFSPKMKGYPYNPGLARELLAEAGYPGGRGIPPLTMLTVSKAQSVRNELLKYKEYLADIGIELNLQVAENWKSFVKRITSREVPLYYAAWYADYPDADNFLYILCHSRSKVNRMGYANPEIDRMLDQARVESDYMTRVALYREIEQKVLSDAPIICQHVNSFNYFFQPWVNGIDMNHLGTVYLPFNEIWINR